MQSILKLDVSIIESAKSNFEFRIVDEHILPQKWQANYFLNVRDDIIKEKIEHIGNKIPFEKKLNIVAGNGYIGKKKKLKRWNDEYAANPEVAAEASTLSAEQLAMIEEFKKKGWV